MSIPTYPTNGANVYSQNFAISGLETLTVVMPVAGQFTMSGKIKLPRLSQTDPTDPNYLNYPSQVVATIKQNGTTVFTTTAGSDGFSIPIQSALSDSFTVQLSSAGAAGTEDQILNAVSAVISIG
jgi:hypothetical protein